MLQGGTCYIHAGLSRLDDPGWNSTFWYGDSALQWRAATSV